MKIQEMSCHQQKCLIPEKTLRIDNKLSNQAEHVFTKKEYNFGGRILPSPIDKKSPTQAFPPKQSGDSAWVGGSF